MRYVKELSNRNRIVSEKTCKSFYKHNEDGAYTIKFVFEGVENCIISKRQVNIFPDSFVMLNAGTKFNCSIDAISPVNTMSLSFDESFVKDFNEVQLMDDDNLLDGRSKSIPFFTETLYPFIGDMKYTVLHLKNRIEKGIDNEILINEYLYHCLLNYYSIYQKEVLQKTNKLSFARAKTREEILRRLILAKEYINSNYNNNLLLEDISSYCYLSVNHLLRTFKEAYGTSPYQYLMQLRLNRAKHLLKTTEYPLNEIVGLVGLENTSSFVRMFKQVVNMTPSKFRRQQYA